MAESLTELRSAFRWDENALRYRTRDGRFVADRAVKRAVNTFVARTQREIMQLGRQVSRGEITVGDFQRQMAVRLKGLHLASSAAARGGFDQLTPRALGQIGNRLRFQYGRLDRFAAQIASGTVPPGTIEARTAMYAGSGVQTYEQARRDGAVESGRSEERRVLGNSEHCPDCIEEAEKGWQPLGTLAEIGDSVCLTNCHCTFEFR